jgi:gas vesicle structural protein
MAIAYERPQNARLQGSRAGVQKMGGSSGLAEVLAVILEKGIVVDVWVRVSIIGIEILTVEIRAVIAAVDTYLRYAEAIGLTALAAAPRVAPPQATPLLPPPMFSIPSSEEILAYLEAHPDGVRLSELQAYFGAERAALESMLSGLVAEGAAELNRETGVFRPGLVTVPLR